MVDQTTLGTNGPAAEPRNFVILVDCLQESSAGLFADGSEGLFLLRLAGLLASGLGGQVLLFSAITVPAPDAISSATVTAQTRRQRLESEAVAALSTSQTHHAVSSYLTPAQGASATLIASVVRVCLQSEVALEVRRFIQGEERALVLLPLRASHKRECPWLQRALRNPLPADLAWVRPTLAGPEGTVSASPFDTGMRVLLPARGGPQAELALEISAGLSTSLRAQVNLLHVLQEMPERMRAAEEAPFTELLQRMDEVHPGLAMARRIYATGGDLPHAIAGVARNYDLVIMGAGGTAATDIGTFTEQVVYNIPSASVVLKTRLPVGPAIRAARRRARPRALDPEALSLVVDKWFAENTFHANEFSDLHRLVDMKHQRGLTVSLALPALNEESTIGNIITVLRKALMEDVPLLDEMVLIDSNSTDRTREIAEELGVPVYIHQQVLPEAGEPYSGKGEALWKSLHAVKGDIIAWVDTDVVNMHPQFVYGLVGPLLREPRIGYVKGYYHRPIRSASELQDEGGGRVTELTVRPLLNLFFPLLSGMVQPLSGEYAARREVLEQLPFFSGYGVETGLLIDLLERFGLNSIGQVNLEKRVHRNRPLSELSLTAFAIVQVILTRLEDRARITLLEEVNRSMKLIRFERDHLSLEVRRVRDIERPPILNLPAYMERRASLAEGE